MTKTLTAAAIVLLAATSARAQETTRDGSTFRKYLIGVAVAQAADNITTQIAMTPYIDATGQRVAHGEVCPWLSADRGANAIAQVGGTIAALVVLHRMEATHPRLARAIAAGLMGVGAVDTTNNLRTVRR